VICGCCIASNPVWGFGVFGGCAETTQVCKDRDVPMLDPFIAASGKGRQVAIEKNRTLEASQGLN